MPNLADLCEVAVSVVYAHGALCCAVLRYIVATASLPLLYSHSSLVLLHIITMEMCVIIISHCSGALAQRILQKIAHTVCDNALLDVEKIPSIVTLLGVRVNLTIKVSFGQFKVRQ
jgi:hypothetical protein